MKSTDLTTTNKCRLNSNNTNMNTLFNNREDEQSKRANIELLI